MVVLKLYFDNWTNWDEKYSKVVIFKLFLSTPHIVVYENVEYCNYPFIFCLVLGKCEIYLEVLIYFEFFSPWWSHYCQNNYWVDDTCIIYFFVGLGCGYNRVEIIHPFSCFFFENRSTVCVKAQNIHTSIFDRCQIIWKHAEMNNLIVKVLQVSALTQILNIIVNQYSSSLNKNHKKYLNLNWFIVYNRFNFIFIHSIHHNPSLLLLFLLIKCWSSHCHPRGTSLLHVWCQEFVSIGLIFFDDYYAK